VNGRRDGLDVVTAIVAVFVGGIGVSIATNLAVPIIVGRGVENRTEQIGAYFALAAVGSFLGAALVCTIFGFDGRPTYRRVLAAMLLGEAANALVRLASETAWTPGAAAGLSPLAWAGFALSVFILMNTPRSKDRDQPQWEYKLPPGAVWSSELEKPDGRRGRA
jgi:hypothetical protein